MANTFIQRLFFFLFSLIIVINPFPLGSNRIWAWSFEGMISLSLLSGMLLYSIFVPKCLNWKVLLKMKKEIWLIVFWLLINLLYLIPLPLSILELVSPAVADRYQDMGFIKGYLSLDVSASLLTTLLTIYYCSLFVLGVVLINSRKRIIFIMALILVLGIVESIYGMYLVSIDQTGVFIQVNTVTAHNISGTFINKNHLVAFLSLSFIIGLGLRLILTKKDDLINEVNFKIKIIRFISAPIRVVDFSLFLIFVGIWGAHSRAGLLSFLLSILFFYLYRVYNYKLKFFNMKFWLATVFIGCGLLIIVADDVRYILNSLGGGSEDQVGYVFKSAEGRVLAAKQAFANFGDYLYTGVGPGAYPVFFVNYRSIEQLAFFDHAHNDYIEFLVEYGLLSLVIFVFMFLIMLRIFRFIRQTDRDVYRLLGITVFSCVVYIASHGFLDFNARIPANVVTIIVVISLIYGRILRNKSKYG